MKLQTITEKLIISVCCEIEKELFCEHAKKEMLKMFAVTTIKCKKKRTTSIRRRRIEIELVENQS